MCIRDRNLRLTRNLLQFVPLAERGRLLGELCESNAQMFSEVQTRMTRLWSDTWVAIWRPYDVEPGPYAPKLARRRRHRVADSAKQA